MTTKKFILIDGNSLVYRAFFALPATLTTSSGVVTNAAYGFTSMLIRLLKDEKPDSMIVAFDKGKPSRIEKYEEYKAHRPQAPDELKSQFPLVKDILKAMSIPIAELPGCEADDILATLAKKLEKDNQVLIVTGDRDALQLISPSVSVLATKRGITDTKLYDRKGVIERFGVPPEKMADLLGLKGDPSDNIPGVPGVGEKTASKLIQEFGSLESVIENIENIKPTRFREAVRKNCEIACLSKELAILETDLPIEIHPAKCIVGKWDPQELVDVFESLEFDTLLKRLLEEDRPGPAQSLKTIQIEAEEVISIAGLEALAGLLEQSAEFSMEAAVEGKYPADLKLKALFFSLPEPCASVEKAPDVYSIHLQRQDAKIPKEIVLQRLRPLFESRKAKVCSRDGKAKILALMSEGIAFNGLTFDCDIAAALLKPGEKFSLPSLAAEVLGIAVKDEANGEPDAESAFLMTGLKEKLERKLVETGLWHLFEKVEMPLIKVLANMEWIGVGIDTAVLRELSTEMEKSLKDLECEIYKLAGEEFNINSSRQLGKILFEKLGLEAEKKTKTGYSTDSSVLNKLIDGHPIVEKIVCYRELAKLKSTYVDALPKLVNPRTGRLHTTFSQAATATGRLSSSNPNLQNIPVRTDLGRRVREAFLPARGTDELLVADYSQIELRILAHLSESDSLLKAFANDEDIHRATAAEVFGIEPEAVDSELRRRAKAVNFGIVYGISCVGLAEQLGISKEEAQDYIDKYFERYFEVRKFIDKTIAEAYSEGHVVTILGRRRPVPELKSGNYQTRSLGERLAINTRIQGSAADIIKMAMIEVDRDFTSQGLQAKMILQVHDELVFEVPPMEREIVFELVKARMENAYSLKARLKVDMAFGCNWREAK